MDTTQPLDNVVTMSSGYQLRILGMPQTLIDKINSGKKYPPVPTYPAPTATDPDARLPHEHRWVKQDVYDPQTETYITKDVLHSTLTTDADYAAWDDWKVSCRVEDKRVSDLILNAILLRGIEVLTAGVSDEWEQIQAMLGIDVPTGVLQKKLHWIGTEVVRTEQDLTVIFRESVRMSGITEEQLNTVMGSFRNKVEGQQTPIQSENKQG